MTLRRAIFEARPGTRRGGHELPQPDGGQEGPNGSESPGGSTIRLAGLQDVQEVRETLGEIQKLRQGTVGTV